MGRFYEVGFEFLYIDNFTRNYLAKFQFSVVEYSLKYFLKFKLGQGIAKTFHVINEKFHPRQSTQKYRLLLAKEIHPPRLHIRVYLLGTFTISEASVEGGGGNCPPTFWQNRRRFISTCSTSCPPPHFKKLLTPLYLILCFIYN